MSVSMILSQWVTTCVFLIRMYPHMKTKEEPKAGASLLTNYQPKAGANLNLL